MFDSLDPSGGSEENHQPLFTAKNTLSLFGHRWTLVFKSRPVFEANVDRYTPKISLAVGLCVSLMIFFFLRTQEKITDRAFSMARNMTSALRESEERYRILNDTLPLGVSIISPDMEILASNETKRRWFPGHDTTQHPVCYKVYNNPPGTGPCRGCPVIETYRDGMPHTAEREAVTVKGNRILFLRTIPVYGPDGKITSVHETVEDITEQKQAEIALKKSEQKYRLLAENALDIIWTVDLDGRLTYVSPAIEKLIGFTDAEVLNMPMTDYIVEEDCKTLLEDLAAELAKPPEKRLQSQTREMRYKTRDGRTVDVEFTATWLTDDQGRAAGIQGNTRDMTERKQAETNRIARLTAEAANREKSLFLSNMSHEIRTPLNAILGFAQILERDASLSPRQMEQIRSINRGGRHLLHLINDILDMSKIEAGMIVIKPIVFCLQDLLGDLEMMFRSRTDAAGLQLLVEQDTHLPDFICCDESRLRQVLINLIGNAVKFTEKGGVSVRARMAPDQEQPAGQKKNMRLVIEVEDSGPGISRKDLDSIFEPFRQSEAGAKAGGTGLGLAISRKLVEMMGGRLTVESEVSKGSCFRFDVLLEPVETLMEKEIKKPDNIVGLDLGTGPWRILIADDIKTNRELLLSLLKPMGFDIREAENGVRAIEIFQEWAPHAVLMDMRMPVMDGYEATRRIKADPAGQDIPVIAVTASAFKESREEILATGVSGYLRKPFRMEELYEILGQCLGLGYVYAEGLDTLQTLEKIPALTPESLADLPGDLVRAMQKAVAEGDIMFLIELISRVEVLDESAAQGLRALADRYDYARLNELLGKGDSENG
jgi:PAS domain S-box-containing protein